MAYRLFKLTLLSGVLLSIPICLVTAWYAWSAYASLDRYARAAGGRKDRNLELFQIALHDELARDIRRMGLPTRPLQSRLPLFELVLNSASIDALERGQVRESESSYVKGSLRKDNAVHDVSVRVRGAAHWNWIGQQKTLKVRLESGDLLDDTRVFSLVNDPSPFGLEEQIILDIARRHGLLTPEYFPVRVRLNNSDMGVYRYEAQPDEGLLRRNRRMPGSLFSGDTSEVDAARGVGALFFSRAGWTKVASKSVDRKEDYAELDRLLAVLNAGTYLEFAQYARDSLALDKYALFAALDVVFGGNEHDYSSNHKLYVDPYTGRIEPIAWGYRAFHHEARFDLVENPLLLRLVLTPGFVARRDAAAYELLTGDASLSEVRHKADALFATLRPELEADPYWDAYKLLPRASRFTRFMVRPMTTSRWLLASEDDLDDFARRSRFLLDELEADSLTAHARSSSDGHSSHTGDGVSRVDFDVRGHGAYRLDHVVAIPSRPIATPSGSGRCEGIFTIYADADRDGRLSPTDPEVGHGALGAQAAIATHADLLAGMVLVPLEGDKPEIGKVRSQIEPRRYSYFVRSPCRLDGMAALVHSVVTGSSARLELPLGRLDETDASARADHGGGDAHGVPRLEPGDRAPHPWDLPQEPLPETVSLAGEIRVDTTRVYGAHQTVRIAAGTRLALGPGASLVFFGPVFAAGTLTRPVVIERATRDAAFGGIALQGDGTAGSRFTNIVVRGGSRPLYATIEYPGMINIHATHDVVIEGGVLEQATGSADVLHVSAVRSLAIHELTIRNAPVDALDLELSDVEVRGFRAVDAGDDCLDLMGVKLRLTDSELIGCTHNAISAGEETELAAHNVLIADSRTGILAKNASQAHVSRTVIYRVAKALQAKRREVRYNGPSIIGIDELFVIDSPRLRDAEQGTRIDIERVQLALPAEDDLPHLAEVLHITTWGALDAHLAELRARGARTKSAP